MSDIEILLTDLGKITTRELTKKYKLYGLDENKKIAEIGGNIAKNTRDDIENKLGDSVITNENNLNYKYIENNLIKKSVVKATLLKITCFWMFWKSRHSQDIATIYNNIFSAIIYFNISNFNII